MQLPVNPPVLPMLAKRVDQIPEAGPHAVHWMFEPKWDGFRALIFRDGDEILIQSRDTKPLNRYFPEVVGTLREQLPLRCVLDGELVIATGHGLDFDSLQLRLHPAASRVKLLSQQIPASVVFFDLLCEGDEDLRGQPFEHRRKRLEALLHQAKPPLHLTPATLDPKLAADWFRRFEGAGLDGVMAKPLAGPYEPDKRVMLKVKHERECDCVVAGFRWHKGANRGASAPQLPPGTHSLAPPLFAGSSGDGEGTAVGSLLLGLFDDAGSLQHVGVCSSFTNAKRVELVEFLAPYREDALKDHPWGDWAAAMAEAGHRMPGGQSRWSQGKDLSWEPLRCELVAEVAYEHMQGSRFRHLAHFRRWRDDKRPLDCTYAQLEVVPPHELKEIFSHGR